MSQVRNLRAMFEQKGDTSPPERGRSPGSISPGPESPRPLSKVRTNFIAIEKDGRIGLQREQSRDSNTSVSTRKLSGELDGTAPLPGQHMTPPKPFIKEQTVSDHPLPTSHTQNTSPPPTKPMAFKAQAPPSNPDKKVDVEEPKTKMVPGAPTDQEAVTSAAVAGTGSTGVSGEEIKVKAAAPKTPPGSIIASAGGAPRPAMRSDLRTTTRPAAKPAKAPTTTKDAKGLVKPAQKAQGHTPEKKATSHERASASKTGATVSKPPVSAARRSPSIQSSPPTRAHAKPTSKSPTRPVKLSPSLMTHTAASGSKVNVPRHSPSRASGTLHAPEASGRSPSRASVPSAGTPKASVPADKNLKRQSSTIGRPRPSLGPPPKPTAKDHPPTKKEREVDESFLARMMRPTQASSSKTIEKAHLSPPRKLHPAPAMKKAEKTVPKHAAATGLKKPATIKPHAEPAGTKRNARASAPAHRTDSRTGQPSAGQPSAGQPSAGQPSAAEKVAPVVEQAATADEAISVAKESEGPISLPEDDGLATSAQEIAPVAEQAVAADEVIEVAKKVEGSATLPDDLGQATTAQEVAPVAEQAATADEVAGAAKAVEGTVTLPDDLGQATSAQEVAPVAEQAATAEDAVVVAKEIEGPAPLPEEAMQKTSAQVTAPVVEQLETLDEAANAAESAESEAAAAAKGDASQPAEESIPEAAERSVTGSVMDHTPEAVKEDAAEAGKEHAAEAGKEHAAEAGKEHAAEAEKDEPVTTELAAAVEKTKPDEEPAVNVLHEEPASAEEAQGATLEGGSKTKPEDAANSKSEGETEA